MAEELRISSLFKDGLNEDVVVQSMCEQAQPVPENAEDCSWLRRCDELGGLSWFAIAGLEVNLGRRRQCSCGPPAGVIPWKRLEPFLSARGLALLAAGF